MGEMASALPPPHDTTRMGWKLEVGHNEPDPALFLGTKFELVPILREGETIISSEEMRERALQQGVNFGLRFGEWLMVNPHKIPAYLESDCCIPLPGTVFLTPEGFRYIYVIRLEGCGERWYLRLEFSEISWYPDDNCRFLRPLK